MTSQNTCNGTLELPPTNVGYGNQLFIYFMGRIFAEKHHLNLINPAPSGCFNISKNNRFGNPPSGLRKYALDDRAYDQSTDEIQYYGKGHYLIRGHFQFENALYKNKNLVLSWITYAVNPEDTVSIHVRLDDFYAKQRHLIININYYIDCIKKYADSYSEVQIVCDKLRRPWEVKYMKSLMSRIANLNKTPIYKPNSIADDMKTIYNSSVIITSNSTFCFWATFLSNAQKIISFPYSGLDVLRNNTLRRWKNNASFFRYDKDSRFLFNYEYNSKVINFFEKMY